ncbi:MAG: hypothetical protein HY814_13985 [Candidatus Riflebacteria bacterium]|nr:hypothetical protein [Candidatus Riflebacteria bacterium]
MRRTVLAPLVLSLFAAVTAGAEAPAPAPSWANEVASAIQTYQQRTAPALQPLYAELDTVRKQAAAAPSNPPGSLVPPSRVASLQAYRELFVLATLPDKWSVDLLSRAMKARDLGEEDRAAASEPQEPYAKFRAAFARSPRGLTLPKLPSPAQPETADVPAAQVLTALQKAVDAQGHPDADRAFLAYQSAAEQFTSGLAAKIEYRVRGHLLTLKGALAKLLPEMPPEWSTLPDPLRRPAIYFMASYYFQGHGGETGRTSAIGTGSGDAASEPSDRGTGAGDTQEPGSSGTGSGDEAVEPSVAGTGTGTSTPDVFKERPGTGTGKVKGVPTASGTGS